MTEQRISNEDFLVISDEFNFEHIDLTGFQGEKLFRTIFTTLKSENTFATIPVSKLNKKDKLMMVTSNFSTNSNLKKLIARNGYFSFLPQKILGFDSISCIRKVLLNKVEEDCVICLESLNDVPSYLCDRCTARYCGSCYRKIDKCGLCRKVIAR